MCNPGAMGYIEIPEINVVTVPRPIGIPYKALGKDSPLLAGEIE
jgi:hypothetical protein